MINANEIRIGNLVNLGIINSIEKSKDLYLQDIIGCTSSLGAITRSDINALIPIPLTAEILLKCGFEKTIVPMKIDIKYIDYRMGQFVLFILPKGIVEVEFCASHNTIEERGYLCSVKYLHQLQNLFYCLCGKELELNIK